MLLKVCGGDCSSVQPRGQCRFVATQSVTAFRKLRAVRPRTRSVRFRTAEFLAAAHTVSERFGGSLHLLNSNLNLHELNDWIRDLDPDEPYALSVFILQQPISDPVTARIKGQEFMELLLTLSQIINPFGVEIAANEMLTGWKYLHTS